LQHFHDDQRRFSNGRGSFQQVVQNIELACQHGLIPNICVTVTAKNAAGLAELIEWILHRELPFSINFFRQNDYSGDHDLLQSDEANIIQGMLAAFKVIEQNLPHYSLLNSLVDRADLSVAHERPCAAGDSYLVIDPAGRIAKCQMEINTPVTSVWATDPLQVVQVSTKGVQNFSVMEKEGCKDCHWKAWCAGGCPQETFRATGRYDVKSPNCNIYKTLYPEVVRLEALRLLKYQQDFLYASCCWRWKRIIPIEKREKSVIQS
ncbi:MAG: SPASM domain-containing protein, partial [Calditrichaeota bacterium]